MSILRCRRRYCGALVDLVTDGLGRVEAVCALCQRNRQGRCRDCPTRLADAHAMRCQTCAQIHKRALGRVRDRERYPTRRRAVLAHHKRRQAIPAIREHKRRYMVAYRQTHPRDGLDRAYQRAYMAGRRADPVYRRRQNARKRELRQMARERAA